MKLRILIGFIAALSLLGCNQQKTKNTFIPLILNAIDHNKDGNNTPVSIQFNKPMVSGDTLTVRHKQKTIAVLTLSGALRLKTFHIRIRALGDGKVSAALERKGKATLYSDKFITVGKFSDIPERNQTKLKIHQRTKDGTYKVIIMNDSSVAGHVKRAEIDFGHGKAIITGSKYLSKNPYFSFKPRKLGKQPTTTVTLN